MSKQRLSAFLLILMAVAVGYFVYSTQVSNVPSDAMATSTPHVVSRYAFKLGLDLNGGTHLVYEADVSKVALGEVGDSMEALRDVIERRVNLFGVSEPLVQVESGSVGGAIDQKLVVELPGVTDINEAIALIGQTPLLEFRLVSEGESVEGTTTPTVIFEDTGITGSLVKRAQVGFESTISTPYVLLEFNSEGRELFAEVTREHVGEILGIFLDGQAISLPVINEEIRDGTAQITGNFTPEEAKLLVRDLNYGALPVPIKLLSTQSIGPTLGAEVLRSGVIAGVVGLILVMLFMTVWYRLPGLAASLALLIYAVLNLALFKVIGVTLTAAGIAGFIISLGMSVDGNVLIFERMKEELRFGKKLRDAINDGFKRAWTAIWDGNVTALVSAIVLFWFGTSLVKGFALTFGLGIILSMLSSFTITRIFLYALVPSQESALTKFLFGSGIGRTRGQQV